MSAPKGETAPARLFASPIQVEKVEEGGGDSLWIFFLRVGAKKSWTGEQEGGGQCWLLTQAWGVKAMRMHFEGRGQKRCGRHAPPLFLRLKLLLLRGLFGQELQSRLDVSLLLCGLREASS
jgi:hypothetical protein